MDISFNYGQRTLSLTLPGDRILGILESREVTPSANETELIKQAMENPINSPPLENILRKGEKTTLIVPDKTRKCGADLFLPVILEKLNACGINDSDITLLFANGSHGPHSEDEKRQIVGPEIFKRIKNLDHDCRRTQDLVHAGETLKGTSVFLNKYVIKAERLIVTGAIRHHYFAGYGGGPKLINPGCAGYQTITANHRLMIHPELPQLHPACRDGNTQGNPLFEDIKDSLKFVRVDFMLNTILDRNDRIIAAVAGELVAAHRRGCQIVDSWYRIPVEKQADLVVVSCGGFPRDINLVQSHKSIHNAFHALKKGGVMIVLAQCPQGIGSDTFLEWFDFRDIQAMHRALLQNFKINGNTALALKYKANMAKLILVSELERELVQKMGLYPAHSLRNAMALAQKYLPPDYKTYIIPHGSLTVPDYKGNRL